MVGVALAGLTGLLVWGQAETNCAATRGRIGTVHFWLGIAIAASCSSSRGRRWTPTPGTTGTRTASS